MEHGTCVRKGRDFGLFGASLVSRGRGLTHLRLLHLPAYIYFCREFDSHLLLMEAQLQPYGGSITCSADHSEERSPFHHFEKGSLVVVARGSSWPTSHHSFSPPPFPSSALAMLIAAEAPDGSTDSSSTTPKTSRWNEERRPIVAIVRVCRSLCFCFEKCSQKGEGLQLQSVTLQARR